MWPTVFVIRRRYNSWCCCSGGWEPLELVLDKANQDASGKCQRFIAIPVQKMYNTCISLYPIGSMGLDDLATFKP